MQRLKRIAAFLTAVFFLSACNLEEGAESSLPAECKIQEPAPMPSGAPTAPPARVQITPDSLREMLFAGNTSVLIGMNRLYRAKEQVNLARANLLPSLNLGMLLYSSSNPSFVVASVNALLPFLVPSNWFKYHQAKDLLQADNVALRLLKLNEYASAYSLYFMIQGDLELQQLLDREARDLARIEAYVQQLYDSGVAGIEDLNRAKGQTALARVQASGVRDLIAKEVAAIRRATGTSLETRIEFEPAILRPSEEEMKSLAEILQLALDRAPEAKQLAFLRSAAHHETWNQAFGFFTGVGLQSPAGDSFSRSVAFDNLSLGASVNIGFATIPAVKISQANERELQLRENELPFEFGGIVESSVNLLQDAKARELDAELAERSFNAVYETQLIRYQEGVLDLESLLRTESQRRQSALESLRARTQVALQRVVLHRILLSDQFEKIGGCAAVQ